MPQPAGAEAPTTSVNGAILASSLSTSRGGPGVPVKHTMPSSVSESNEEPQSPNSLLKQTLKIGGSSGAIVAGSGKPHPRPGVKQSSQNTATSRHLPPGQGSSSVHSLATIASTSLEDRGIMLSTVQESSGVPASTTTSTTYTQAQPNMPSPQGSTEHDTSSLLDSSARARGPRPVGAEDAQVFVSISQYSVICFFICIFSKSSQSTLL